jgi:hypothetical protein
LEICEFHSAHAPDVHFVRCHRDRAIVEEEDMSIGSLRVLWIHSRCDDCPATLCKCFHHRVVHLCTTNVVKVKRKKLKCKVKTMPWNWWNLNDQIPYFSSSDVSNREQPWVYPNSLHLKIMFIGNGNLQYCEFEGYVSWKWTPIICYQCWYPSVVYNEDFAIFFNTNTIWVFDMIVVFDIIQVYIPFKSIYQCCFLEMDTYYLAWGWSLSVGSKNQGKPKCNWLIARKTLQCF